MNQKLISILSVVCLVFSGFVILGMIPDNGLVGSAKAETWTQTTETEFNAGETTFVDTEEGTLKLTLGLNRLWYGFGEAASDYFGRAVASAGDVNGDGFDDVLVGSPNNNDGGNTAGKAYLYYGSANGPSEIPVWSDQGEAAGDYYGRTLAAAGDVNGDGYDDIIVGAYLNDGGGISAGEAYVYYGGPSGLSVIPDWSDQGEAASDSFGYSVSGAGDVNNDGYDDILVGAIYNDDGGSNAGEVYVYYGSASGPSLTPDWSDQGEAASDYFGWSVAGVGDANDDGFDEIIIGAHYNDGGGSQAGEAYVYYGSVSGPSLTPDWSDQGEAANDFFGFSVASAGDTNGDGYSDIIVGAYSNDGNGGNAGEVYVYYGSVNGPSAIPDWSDQGEVGGDYFGYSVSGADDVNGDGYDDLVVGAYLNDGSWTNAGEAYVYYGSINGPSASPDWSEQGEVAGDFFGYSVAGAGDVNSDGYSDIIVGAYYNDDIGTNAGKAYVYGVPIKNFNQIWHGLGEAQGDLFGWSVASAGDVNGDGFSDVIVGAQYNDGGGDSAGEAYVYYGSANGPNALPDWTDQGEAENDYFGGTVAGAGDVNGDGYDDIIVGAYGNDGNGSSAGEAYVYYGGASGLSTTPDWSYQGHSAGDTFGSSVASAGDVNGDGYNDVIIGAPLNTTSTLTRIGAVYAFYGSSSGLSTSPDWSYIGQNSEDQLGYSLAGAGDVNGDGYDDIVIGAPYNDYGGTNAGRIYCFEGTSFGLRNNPDWNEVGEANSDSFGYSLSGAGDVNGDGYNDIVVGAPNNDNVDYDAGKAYLYYGTPAGMLSTTPDWTALGEKIYDEFGVTVSNTGDVNNDGFDDIIIGTYTNHEGGGSAGKAYLYLGSETGPSNISDWTGLGDRSDNFGSSLAGAGDVNNDGFDDFIIGARNDESGDFNGGAAYVFSISFYAECGRYISDTFSVEGYEKFNWLSIDWRPFTQPQSTSIKFQIATNDDGVIWNYIGPDGTQNSYFTNPHGQTISTDQLGRYLKVRIYLTTELGVRTPTISEFSVNYKFYEYDDPEVTLTSPNGGEDWMKEEFYPITWKAKGDFNSTPVRLYYSVDNGETWTAIVRWIVNWGHYNWTVPNIETSNALVKVLITDIYGNLVSDTSDMSFAIDPPPPEYKPADIEIDNNEPIDSQPKTADESEDSLPSGSQGKGGNDLELGLLTGALVMMFISIVIMLFTIFFVAKNNKNNDQKKQKVKPNLKSKIKGRNKMFRKPGILVIIAILVLSGLTTIPFGMDNVDAGTFTQTSSTSFKSGETIFTDASTNYNSVQLMQEPDLAWTSIGNDYSSAYYGRSVASAGDVNADGYDDVIVGAYYDDTPTATRPGVAYLYLGSATGLETEPAWSASGNDENYAYFGWSLAGAGDVNGDGYDDVIIGATQEDHSTYTNCGMVFIYLGSPSGLQNSIWYSTYLNADNGYFGREVAGAGDVNGDGYDDFLVGTELYDTGSYTNNGGAWLYLGAANSGSVTQGWIVAGAQTSAFMGSSVAGAGDVNNDGYDDWLIGARGMTSGSSIYAGTAYLYLGAPGSLSGATAAWVSSGTVQSFSYFGSSVAGAGDVNNDGYDDWLVGQHQYDISPSGNEGKAYVYLGSESVSGTSHSWTSSGNEGSGDRYGWSLAGVDDFNGDGYDDWVVGAYGYGGKNSDCGKVYLYTGSAYGFSPQEVWGSVGDDQATAYYGYSVSGAGDVNDDGTHEFIVGAYPYDTPTTNAGKAYLYMNHITVAQTTPLWESVGENKANTYYGKSAACAGDINADGFDDWLVGAPVYDSTITNIGKAYLYLGSATGLSKTAAWSSTGESKASAQYGHCVAGAGDVNNDGFDDWLVSAVYFDTATLTAAGKVYLYLGRATSISSITSSWSATGTNAFSNFGHSIDGLGDVNNDGYDDWIVGEPGYDYTTSTSVGQFSIYLGSGSVAGTTPAVSIYSGTAYDLFGRAVAGVGDVNGDGYDDWIVSGYQIDSSSSINCGAVFLYLGKSSVTSLNYIWSSYGDDQAQANYGYSVAGVGDVNGDGYSDWMVGAQNYDKTSSGNEGKAYLYLGRQNIYQEYPSPSWTSSGENILYGHFGYSMDGAGDVNGDGYDDWVIGAQDIDTPIVDVGKAYLFLGGTGLSSQPKWTSQGEYQRSQRYAHYVSGAGDVNGDGCDEWLVGAYPYDSSNIAVGKVYMYRTRGYCEYGEFVSSVCDGESNIPDVWQSIKWNPLNQIDVDLKVKFQVATNDDGITWDFIGPDGTSNSHFTHPNGEAIYPEHIGRYLRYKAIFQVERKDDRPVTRTPVIDDVTVHYGKPQMMPTVTVLTPNGGEDWMKKEHYPITWEADGLLGDNPIIIYYSLDNGDTWVTIASDQPNDGIYNWTVPSYETANAFIRINVTDIYSKNATDISDASFAIDPPPPEYKPADNEIDNKEPIDSQPKSTEGSEDSIPSNSGDKNGNDLEGNLITGTILIISFLIISIIINIFLFAKQKDSNRIDSTTDSRMSKNYILKQMNIQKSNQKLAGRQIKQFNRSALANMKLNDIKRKRRVN